MAISSAISISVYKSDSDLFAPLPGLPACMTIRLPAIGIEYQQVKLFRHRPDGLQEKTGACV